MRIPIWPGIRLSIWEPQDPDAVKVTLAFIRKPPTVRRVLSMRGWMILLVRYDWRDTGSTAASGLGSSVAEQRIADALDVIHEWQRFGPSNDYLTRVHRALRPPVSRNSQYVGTTKEPTP